MELKILPEFFSVCKVASLEDVNMKAEYFFIARTDQEISLVCLTKDVPANTVARDDSWLAFRVQGILTFSLVGILSKITTILADNGISVFAISTYNTDYVLFKLENFDKAMEVLSNEGYEVVMENSDIAWFHSGAQ